ncbi:MAG: response regulator [Clostridiales bacterium]|nr:response regulator [Eubacterium sp.]MDD7348681.1 response regulator [Clostridiales bacterium]
MKIIVADDEPLALEDLEDAVRGEKPKAEIYAFSNPMEILSFARETACDIAFLDIDMGCMSGIDVAKQLKIWYPKINIIFVTAYSEYMHTAIKMRASGYVTKPVTKEDVRDELGNLRNPVIQNEKDKLTVRCFGNFDVFVDGHSLKFERNKTKEMLAYLVDRRGSSVTSGELRAVLWEGVSNDKNTGTYLQILKKDLISTLKREGFTDVLVTSWNQYAIDTQKIVCDYYDFLAGKPEGIRAYNGEYMSQYSWGEVEKAHLEEKIDKNED